MNQKINANDILKEFGEISRINLTFFNKLL